MEEFYINDDFIQKEFVDFAVNADSNLIIVVAQIPVEWEMNDNFVVNKYPEKQWKLIKQTLSEIKETKFDGRIADIALFPELAVPHEYIQELKELVGMFNSSFILLAGIDYVSLEEYVELLRKSNNSNKDEQVVQITEQSSDYENIKQTKPVNFCSIFIQPPQNANQLDKVEVKQYFQPKLFPSVYEQTGSRDSQILQSQYLLHFENVLKEGGRKRLRKFSFLPLICFDQLYEKSESGESLIRALIDHAENEEAPGFIFILQYNPRMDHIVIDEALYEYYLCLPTRSLRTLTYTIFANVSDKSTTPPGVKSTTYGSLMAFNKKAQFSDTNEHKLIKMGRGNLHKLEFNNTSNRLYFLKSSILFNYQENARSSRNPIEVLKISEYTDDKWEHVYPKRVMEPIEVVLNDLIYPMLDRYCSEELLTIFADGGVSNIAVIEELQRKELFIVLRRGYELTPKSRIPLKLVDGCINILKRLDSLERIKCEKLSTQVDDKENNELITMGSEIRKNKGIINCIIKKF